MTRDVRFQGIAVLLLAGIALLPSCKHRGSMEPVEDADTIRKLEEEVQIALPDDVALVAWRESAIQPVRFWTWLFHSSTGFSMKPADVPSPGVYIPRRDPKIPAKFIQSLVPDQKLPKATAASSLDWEDEQYEFVGTVLETEGGYFLVVKRVRKD